VNLPKRRRKSSSAPPWWLASTPPADETPWSPDSSLDHLDVDERAIRQHRLDEWRRTRKATIARAKRVLEDTGSTPQEKHEAKILIGAYAVDPQLMLASGSGPAYHANQGMAAPANRHPRTPLPPARQATLFGSIRHAIQRVVERRHR
jgi:hypothetical protein